MEVEHNKELYEEIRPWLELVDDSFARRGVELSHRPRQAGFWLVDNAISDVTGGKSADFFEQEWFQVLMNLVVHWYREKYGSDLLKHKKEKLQGLVDFHGLPILLEIAATITEVETEGETAWLRFPDHLLPTEETADLFPVNPSLNQLSQPELQKFWEAVREVVRLSRSTNLYLRNLENVDSVFKKMADSIWSHIEKAISDISSLENCRASVACWELHLAIEKTLKVYVAQKSGKKMHGHDLEKLHDEAKTLGLPELGDLHVLPHHKKAIGFRYGEEAISTPEVFEYYLVALRIIHQIAKEFDRTLSINNAGLLIKKAKWAF